MPSSLRFQAELTEPDAAFVGDFLDRSAGAMAAFAADDRAHACRAHMALHVATSVRNGGKLRIDSNGSSAADARHTADEFSSRLMYDRAPFAAIALTIDTSGLTAIDRDGGFEHLFARQVRAHGRSGDLILVAPSSSTPLIQQVHLTAAHILCALVERALCPH